MPDETKIVRYDHGGRRIYIERENGSRDLVADLYDDEGGERCDAIVAAIIRAGIVAPPND